MEPDKLEEILVRAMFDPDEEPDKYAWEVLREFKAEIEAHINEIIGEDEHCDQCKIPYSDCWCFAKNALRREMRERIGGK